MTFSVDDWDGTKWKVTYTDGDIGNRVPLNTVVTITKQADGKLEVSFASPVPLLEQDYEHDTDSGALYKIEKQADDKYFCRAIHLVPGGSNLSISSVRFVIGDILPSTTGVWGAGGN